MVDRLTERTRQMFKKYAKGGHIPPEPPMFKYENVQTEVERPMNPNAKEDFRRAIEEAKNYANADVRDDAFDAMMSAFKVKRLCTELRYEEHINKAVLTKRYYLDEFVNALLNEGYELTLKRDSNEVVTEITWKDKHDLVDEIKKMAREIEVK